MEAFESMPKGSKCIVFTDTKRAADELADLMYEEEERLDIVCESLHSDKSQRERTQILKAFTQSRITALFATGVAARGLDVKDVSHVVIYDFPKPKGKSGIEDFVHRIGRTARGDRQGEAITLFHAEKDKHQADSLCRILKSVGQEIPEELQAIVPRRQEKRAGGGRGRHRGGDTGGGRSSRRWGRDGGGWGRDGRRRHGGRSGYSDRSSGGGGRNRGYGRRSGSDSGYRGRGGDRSSHGRDWN